MCFSHFSMSFPTQKPGPSTNTTNTTWRAEAVDLSCPRCAKTWPVGVAQPAEFEGGPWVDGAPVRCCVQLP